MVKRLANTTSKKYGVLETGDTMPVGATFVSNLSAAGPDDPPAVVTVYHLHPQGTLHAA
jgi:hypothetical protein